MCRLAHSKYREVLLQVWDQGCSWLQGKRTPPDAASQFVPPWSKALTISSLALTWKSVRCVEMSWTRGSSPEQTLFLLFSPYHLLFWNIVKVLGKYPNLFSPPSSLCSQLMSPTRDILSIESRNLTWELERKEATGDRSRETTQGWTKAKRLTGKERESESERF